MPPIRILPENLSNKIAAGEVVERPASVVKELLENALDAGCRRVFIEIQRGGRSLIRVSDDGCGMNPDDAMLAIERYATSKLQDESTLFAISSLGFRGEALPSIAAVSQFSLVTRETASDSATRIVIHGGTLKSVDTVGAPAGTLVEVRQLFYNTPARRKFMKTVNTEMGHIYDTVAGIALGWPEVQFRLDHNGRPVKQWSAVEGSFARVVSVLGKDLQGDLIPLEHQEPGLQIAGWISSPCVRRSNPRGIYLYVNGRRVRDRVVQQALLQGYAQRRVKGQFPVAVVHLQLPYENVDVNVHPAKHEVRFAEQQRVYETMARITATALQKHDLPAWQPAGAADAAAGAAAETRTRFTAPVPRENPLPLEHDRPELAAAGPVVLPAAAPPPPPSETDVAEGFFTGLRIIGQFQGTYIVCESREAGLLLIDQHAAHERILYEDLKQQAENTEGRAQRLLIPETVELNYQDAQLLTPLLPALNALGLEIEPFGGQTFAVQAVPPMLQNREIQPLIAEMTSQLAETGVSDELENALDSVLVLMACHGAVRAHQGLTETEIKDLLRRLERCRNPSHCPHGRPTWIRWKTSEIEKLFRRTI